MYDAFGNYTGDDGLDAPTRTLDQTQATTPNAPPGVFTGQPVYTEDGGVSNLRRNPETGELYDPGGAAGYAVAPSEAGAGQHPDASQAETISATTQATNVGGNTANDRIVPRPNVLDSFSSYTYRVSVYMMSPEQYRALALSKKKTINGYQLLFQSGGAPVNKGGFLGASNPYNQSTMDGLVGGYGSGVSGPTNTTIPGPNGPDAGRNPAFPLDFYIDDVVIEQLLSGLGSHTAHAVQNIKFSVIEPIGITLIDRIYQAAQDFVPKNGAGNINYNAVAYLMVIHFYGYDSEGNLVPGIRGADASTGLADPNAVIEKFIPFKIKKINWAITGKSTTYEFECGPIGLSVAAGTRRGTIPYDVQLNAGTVGDLLGSKSVYSGSGSSTAANPNQTAATQARTGVNLTNTAAGGGRGFGYQAGAATQATQASVRAVDNAIAATGSPPKANSAPSTRKMIKQGLMGAMNDFQTEICSGANAIFRIPDTYKIVWIPDKFGKQPIRDATIVLPGVKESSATGFSAPATQDPGSVDPSRVSKDTTTRNFSITAGMQIVQAIELAIRNSSYIINQQLVVRNTQTGEEEPNQQKYGQPVQWFNITFSATQKDYDSMRNDTAYEITFYVSPFTIEQYDSKYFPVAKYRGIHKNYQVYFTGKNTAVIDYKEQLNSLYNLTVSGGAPGDSLSEQQRRALTSSSRDIPFFAYQSSSTESRQGTEGTALEPASNLAESFYSPTDLATATLRIIGDPAWVQQGSFAGNIDANTFNWNPFLPDGTINFDIGQTMFEVEWQRPEDYDIDTGLANPYSRKTAQAGQPGASRVYVAKKLTSEFRNGKFEQTLVGSLFRYLKPDATNKAVGATVPPEKEIRNPNQTAAVQARTGVDLTNARAGGGRGFGYQAAGAPTTEYFNKSNTPARPAPVTAEYPTSEPAPDATGSGSTLAPVPMATPAPATDGTGQNISLIDNFLNRSSAPPRKINLDTDFVVQGPQESAPPDP